MNMEMEMEVEMNRLYIISVALLFAGCASNPQSNYSPIDQARAVLDLMGFYDRTTPDPEATSAAPIWLPRESP